MRKHRCRPFDDEGDPNVEDFYSWVAFGGYDLNNPDDIEDVIREIQACPRCRESAERLFAEYKDGWFPEMRRDLKEVEDFLRALRVERDFGAEYLRRGHERAQRHLTLMLVRRLLSSQMRLLRGWKLGVRPMVIHELGRHRETLRQLQKEISQAGLEFLFGPNFKSVEELADLWEELLLGSSSEED